MAKQFLYHVTPKENVQSILRDGLKRGGNSGRGFAVSLSEKPYSWYALGLAIFEVRIGGLKHDMTTFLPESDEILVWGDIPAERVRTVKASEVIPRKILQNLRNRERKDSEERRRVGSFTDAQDDSK